MISVNALVWLCYLAYLNRIKSKNSIGNGFVYVTFNSHFITIPMNRCIHQMTWLLIFNHLCCWFFPHQSDSFKLLRHFVIINCFRRNCRWSHIDWPFCRLSACQSAVNVTLYEASLNCKISFHVMLTNYSHLDRISDLRNTLIETLNGYAYNIYSIYIVTHWRERLTIALFMCHMPHIQSIKWTWTHLHGWSYCCYEFSIIFDDSIKCDSHRNCIISH